MWIDAGGRERCLPQPTLPKALFADGRLWTGLELFFAARLRRATRGTCTTRPFGEPGLQRLDAGGKPFVLSPCLDRHFAHGLEFLALHDVHRVEDALSLSPECGLDLAPHPLPG